MKGDSVCASCYHLYFWKGIYSKRKNLPIYNFFLEQRPLFRKGAEKSWHSYLPESVSISPQGDYDKWTSSVCKIDTVACAQTDLSLPWAHMSEVTSDFAPYKVLFHL